VTRFRLAVAVAAVLAAVSAAAAARAQVTVNPNALDQLAPPPIRPGNPPSAKSSAKPPARSSAGQHGRSSGRPTPLAKAAPPPVKPIVVPPAPPPPPVLPPPIIVPTRPAPPPPPIPVVANAPGAALPRPDGLTVTFGAGRADINPTVEAAVRGLVHAAPPFARTTFTVTAYAAGNADDPSTPRRLALSRALAVRSVLLSEGVPSPRIYVKALGASVAPPEGPADQVTVAVAGAAPQSEQQQQQQQQPPPSYEP
jgi:outer membrane protein OmpA-like peptidoglycan-associated protein